MQQNVVLFSYTNTYLSTWITAACKFPRPNITISYKFRKLRKHILDLTDIVLCDLNKRVWSLFYQLEDVILILGCQLMLWCYPNTLALLVECDLTGLIPIMNWQWEVINSFSLYISAAM